MIDPNTLVPVPRATSGLAPQIDTGMTTLSGGLVATTPGLPKAGGVVTWKKGPEWHELWTLDDATLDPKKGMFLWGSDPLPAGTTGQDHLAAVKGLAAPAGPSAFAHLRFSYYRLPSPAAVAAYALADAVGSLYWLHSGIGPHSPGYAGASLTQTGRLYRVDLGSDTFRDFIVLQNNYTPPDADTVWEIASAVGPTPATVADFLDDERIAQGAALWRFVQVEYTWIRYQP
ncbi:MAG: hypothetical protein ACI8PZ_005952 [Myxococcota bacterium]|jgi:hypothetical protein